MQRVRPYPDELVYSVISRLHFISGNDFVRKSTKQLFGNAEKTVHILWPTRLKYFMDKMNVEISTDEIVMKHTIYPYYSKFLSKDKKDQLLKAMCDGSSRANPSAFLGQNHSGAVTSRLYLCPLCASEDISIFGEPYWHRTHQLPGTMVCHKHNVCLLHECPDCNEPFIKGSNQELNITPIYCGKGHYLYVTKENSNEDLLIIAQENNRLLNTDLVFTQRDIYEKCLDYARAMKYVNVQSSVILYEKLVPDLVLRFTKPLLMDIGISFNGEHIKGFNKFFWKREVSLNPIYIIILILFFGKTLEEFLVSDSDGYAPFGRGPWPCLNQVCSKYLQNTIEAIELKNSRQFAKPRGHFKCTYCQFVYSRLGPDKSQEDRYQFDLIPDTGELWNSKFEELLSAEIIYLNEMADKLGVGKIFLRRKLKDKFGDINLNKLRLLNTKQLRRNQVLEIIKERPGIKLNEITGLDPQLIKFLQKYDLVWLRDNVTYSKKEIKVEDRRIEFLDILHKYPLATRKELCQINPSVYQWLFKYDKSWMLEQLPAIQKSTRGLEDRRKQFQQLLIEYPSATRNELRKMNKSNYTWLKKNDSEWFSKKQPPIEIKQEIIIKTSLENRREKYLELLSRNPHLSRGELKLLDINNYSWLRIHDSEWFERHSPPLKIKGMSHPRVGIEERRSSFLNIYQNNMGATSKELRRLCGSNYTWLHKNDFHWLKQYQPRVRKHSPETGQRTLNKSVEQRREEFLNMKEQNPLLSRTGLQQLNPGLYIWLVTADKEWLFDNLPPKVARKYN
ncbi:TnsD family Tn7-like transposition protein [Paenibacillus sediminis]|uniref:Transposon Tn7 transposition protein TnsD C-termianl domain-containing protein n=1 Tax=Paenibacillus sediminis TaxID=664909 RepID=A0ABS4H4K9_9BACL|nr:TnsD family Tn7-like transposition protein [Paenibacillus sediminis]MBP1937302.1 hypothetical protein [Paenibacillus sediminis]